MWYLDNLLPIATLGCTPLHWAAIRGNVEACAVLVHSGTKQELFLKDKAGFTPAKLASDKGQRHVALFLVCGSTALVPPDLYLFYSIYMCLISNHLSPRPTNLSSCGLHSFNRCSRCSLFTAIYFNTVFFCVQMEIDMIFWFLL